MSQPARRPLTVLLASLALAAGTLAAAPPAAAAKRADLRVTALSASPTTAAPGAQTTIRTTVRNKGRRAARSTRTLVVLSKDAKLHKTDPVLATLKTPKLKPGAKKTLSRTITVPNGTTPGSWQVLACADAKRQVRETKEGNNCRATPLTVTAPPNTTVTFPREPNPLAVESTLQSARAVTTSVNPHEDTTMTATAADGTSYTLTIPAGALLGAENITMTPVASVPDLPLSGGLRAGVQIEPHGLQLLEPATLTIESADLGALAQQTAFLFHEGGDDFHLYPVAAPQAGDDANTVRMTLSHFSTPGLGLASLTDRNTVESHVPERLRSQAEGLIAEATREARAEADGGPPADGDWEQQVIDVENAYFDQVVRPHLADAERSPALAPKAIAEALAWSRSMQLLGDESNDRHREVIERVVRLLEIYLDWSWERCIDQHDLEAIRNLMAVARHAALMSLPFGGEAMDKAQRCATFRVSFSSRVTLQSSWSGTEQTGSSEGAWAVSAPEIKVEGIDFTPPLGGEGALDYTEFTYSRQNTVDPLSTKPCTFTEASSGTTPGTLRAMVVPIARLNVDEDTGEETEEPVRLMLSLLNSGQDPVEHYQRTSCDGSTTSEDRSVWSDTFWANHYGDVSNITTVPSEQAGDFLFAETWSQVETGSSSTASVELWHDPTE